MIMIIITNPSEITPVHFVWVICTSSSKYENKTTSKYTKCLIWFQFLLKINDLLFTELSNNFVADATYKDVCK